MVRFRNSNVARRPGLAAVLRYGLAFASVAAALGLSLILVHNGLPRLFGAFSCAAIAVAFWFGGTGPGLLSVLLSTLAFSFFLFPVAEVQGPGWQSFLAIYAIFGGLVGWFSASRHRAERLLAEARDNLEKRVAERTSELARAEQELRRSEEHLRLVIDTVPALIHTGRPDGYLDYFNRRWLDYVGLPLGEVAGWRWTEMNHPDDVAATVGEWRRSIATGEPFEHESRLRRADGEYRWMLHRKVPLRDERGNIVKWYGSSVDIEDRKRAEEALRRSEELYSKLVNSVDCIVWEADARTLQFLFVSPQAERILGYAPEQWLSPGFWAEHLHADDREWCPTLCKQAAEEGQDHELEYRMVAADGQTIWLHDVVSVQTGPDGPLRLRGVMIDITRRKLAETAAKESGERFRLVFERSTAGMVISDASWQITRANKSFCDFIGYSQDELRDRSLVDLTDADDVAVTLAYIEEAEQHRAPSYDLEKRYVRQNGEIVWGRVSSVFLLQEGRPACWITVVLDITERKRAEEALRASEERWRAVFENSAVGLALTDPEGKYLSSNRAYQEMVGYTDEELRALSYLDVTYEEDRESNREARTELVEGKRRGFQLEKRYRRKDGNLIWVRATVSEAHGADGKFQFGMAVVEDITERKRAEEALRDSEERFRTIFENAGIAMAQVDFEGHPVKTNPALQQMLGYSEEEFSRMAFTEFSHPDDRESDWKLFGELAAGKRDKYKIEKRYLKKDGGVVWGLLVVSLIKDRLGRPMYAVAMAEDITERKRAEDDVRRQKEILQTIFDNAPVMIAFLGPDRKLNLVNWEFERTLGWTMEEMRAHDLDSLLGEFYPDPKHHQEAIKLISTSDTLFADLSVRARDGRMIETSWGKVRLSDGTEIYIGRDITERKRAEEELRKSEERWRSVFENSAIGVALTDLTGRFLAANPVYQKMVGYNEEELRGLAFLNITVEQYREANWRHITELLEGKRQQFQIEKQYRRKDGSLVWVRNTVSLVPGSESVPRFIMALSEDITERKKVEEAVRRSRDQLRSLAARAQRVREEERMTVAREIHDELGQALTAIKLDLSSLIRGLPAERRKQSESTLRLVDDTIQSVRRIATELRPIVLDELGLVAAVEWACEEFQTRTGMKCQLDLPQDDFDISPERATAVFRILQETLTNVARHANATKVNVRLAKEDGDLALEVHDNGKGVSEEQLSAGSSLGILGMRERALLMGGELTITGAPGEGTTVRVQIPETQPHLLEEGK